MICVFCGSASGRAPTYAAAARELGELLAKRGIGLVYGGGNVGLMGELADAVLDAGGRAIGVIPQQLVDREIAHGGLTELHVVENLHQRKALMAELADAFLTLPGGVGTMEELFEVWSWGRLGLHSKPCGLLNVDGYFDSLRTLTDQMVTEGFLEPEYRKMLLIEEQPSVLLDRLTAHATSRSWSAVGRPGSGDGSMGGAG
ncbi:MAG: TIGR00730 family Rossman fold protein [Chloroflexota bacterium]|nr:TIGR00730 family Rossman fold protein [Chloroflexota bacterium]